MLWMSLRITQERDLVRLSISKVKKRNPEL